jgi:hypothetical protein
VYTAEELGVEQTTENGAPLFRPRRCKAVVMNDIEATTTRADKANFEALAQILLWLRHHAPLGSYGSPAALTTWPTTERLRAGSKV